MNQKINVLWLIPVIIISGLIGFISTSYEFFLFQKEINIVNLFSLIITTSFGVYIASNLRKNIEAKKFEKELINEKLNLINNKSKTIQKYLEISSLKFQETVSAFKAISSILSEIGDYNEICSIIDNNELKEIRIISNELKMILTGAQVKDSRLIIQNGQKEFSDKKLKSLQRRIIKLIITINRK